MKNVNLVKGNGLNILKVMPESAVKFGSYEVSFFGRTMLDDGLKGSRD